MADVHKDDAVFFKSTGMVSATELANLARLDHDREITLVIAGLDSGGGAGCSADCQSVADAGSYALVATTALTVQSLKRVGTVKAVEAEFFAETMDTLIADFPKISAVKVGLVTSQEILELILKYLEGPLKNAKVVWDPVLTATAGDFESADLKGALSRILKVSTLFTPNLTEALELASWDEERLNHCGIRELASEFVKQGCAVLIKGGHAKDQVQSSDFLKTAEREIVFSHDRRQGKGAHGGGCALSAFIAGSLAQGYALDDAVALGKSYVTCGILRPMISQDSVRPPVGHHKDFLSPQTWPTVKDSMFPSPRELAFPSCNEDLGFYPVLDSSAWIERVLRLGVRTVQLRIKDPKRADLPDEIERSVELARRYGARLFIDDHYQLAARFHAYGVHLGMEDLQTADLEFIVRSGLRLGVSTHGPCELFKALGLKPSYIALGHVFPTNTKAMPSKPQGLWKLKREIGLMRALHVPFTVIGGITLDNAPILCKLGVLSVAAVSAVTKAEDPDEAVFGYLRLFGCGGDI